MNASMGLKDPSELSYKQAAPLDILRAHSTGSTRGTDVFGSLIARESDLIAAGQRSVLGERAAAGGAAVVGAVADPAT